MKEEKKQKAKRDLQKQISNTRERGEEKKSRHNKRGRREKRGKK